MPVSSLIIRIKEGRQEAVLDAVQNIPEAEVIHVHANGVVVVTDTGGQGRDKSIWNTLENIPGVVQCDLIYHNFEDDPLSHATETLPKKGLSHE